jgi:hypothetical protein
MCPNWRGHCLPDRVLTTRDTAVIFTVSQVGGQYFLDRHPRAGTVVAAVAAAQICNVP